MYTKKPCFKQGKFLNFYDSAFGTILMVYVSNQSKMGASLRCTQILLFL